MKTKCFFITIAILIIELSSKAQVTDTLTVTDFEGNLYHTVTIGTQVWMVENLKTTKYNNGDPLKNTDDFKNDTIGAYRDYNDDENNSIIYGKLYNWFAIHDKDNRNIAPIGWHVPNYEEWNTLITFLGGETVAGGKLKEKGTSHWNSSANATDSFGFTALPSGIFNVDKGYFEGKGLFSCWWSSKEFSLGSWEYVDSPIPGNARNNRVYHWGMAQYLKIYYNQSTAMYSKSSQSGYPDYYGLSIRCIKDKN